MVKCWVSFISIFSYGIITKLFFIFGNMDR